MVNEAIQKCDVDVRRDMWGGIVLTGGGALLPGLRERLEQVTSGWAAMSMHVHVRACSMRAVCLRAHCRTVAIGWRFRVLVCCHSIALHGSGHTAGICCQATCSGSVWCSCAVQ
jgi:Actin